jgi:uncharacterized phage protein (TIGR02218 family)
MRDLPADLAARLAGDATTLCRCWRLTRPDGTVLGFTDHDRDLSFEGTVFAARTGLEAADATAALGFAVGGGEVSGALMSAGIQEADIAAGRYDGAAVETWLVDWDLPAARLLLDRATVGEVRRADDAFVAELRDAMHRLDEDQGRTYRAGCAADLGDRACGVNLADPAYVAAGTIAATDGATGLGADALKPYADGWFTGGRLAWTGGANAGLAHEVKVHRAQDAALDLWTRPPNPLRVGDAFRITAGCDKALATCAAKFANVANFRGFPHMPGNDFVLRYAGTGAPGLDGGSLFR